MTTIAKLVVSLGANTGSFETDMKRATRNQERRMKQMKQSAKAAGQGLAVAFTAAATAMTAVVRSSTKTADEMQKLALRTGITTEALSQYQHVAELSGLSFEQFTNGMKRMSRALSDADVGLSTQKRAFDRLGLSVDSLMKMEPDQQFEEIAEAMTRMESATLRSATAQEIFGRSGTEMLSLMLQGKDGIKAMREEADQLGLTIGQDLADASALFNDNLTRMKGLAEGAGLQFSEGLLPALIKVQGYFLESADAADGFAESGKKLGDVILNLIRGFILLKGVLQTIASALLGMVIAVVNSLRAIMAPITAAMKVLAQASSDLAQGNFAAAWKSLSSFAAQSGSEFEHALEGIKQGIDEVAGSSVYWDLAQKNAAKLMSASTTAAKKFVPVIEEVASNTTDLADATNDAAQAQKDAKAEADAYESSLQSLLDTLYPMEAELRRHGEQLDLLETAYQKGDLSLTEYADAMLRTVSAMETVQAESQEVVQEFDLLTTAIDEGVRILERSFTSMWENLLSGAGGAFDAIKDGFKSLISNLIHQASTQKIILNVQQGIQQGFTAQNLKNIGEGIATFAAVILGAKLGGGGQSANTGAALGSVAGGIIGSYIPVIGTMLGSAIGGLLGGLLGGIFDKKPRIGVGGFNIEPGDTKFFDTALGGVFVGDTKGGMDEHVKEFGDAIVEFDKTIASFLSNDQLGAVAESLESWATEKKGDFATIEEVLRTRFNAILTEFDQNINAFTRKGKDLVEQIDHFAVAISAQNLLEDLPDLFTGRDVTDILAVVSAMQTGIMTISEAWNAFAELLNIIVTVRDALVDFAGSDLGEDFQSVLDLANMSLTEALTGMNMALSDAILNFDGSPEQLQNIGVMVSTIREGEIKLLSQIDAIQKGIQANLATLKADMLGLRDGPRSDEQLFLDAQKFINSISSATSAEEIASLERQFDAAIRAMSPESQASNMASILQMIETFSTLSDTAIEGMKQAVLDSAASTRQLMQDFIDRIGDPLEIIAGTNQEIRDALGGGEVSTTSLDHENNVEDILETGVDEITSAVTSIGPVVANALRSALGGVEINVTVHTGGGLTNQ